MNGREEMDMKVIDLILVETVRNELDESRKWDEVGAREPFGSERTIWETKWGQETAQHDSGTSNDPALQYEDRLENRNKYVWANSM